MHPVGLVDLWMFRSSGGQESDFVNIEEGTLVPQFPPFDPSTQGMFEEQMQWRLRQKFCWASQPSPYLLLTACVLLGGLYPLRFSFSTVEDFLVILLCTSWQVQVHLGFGLPDSSLQSLAVPFLSSLWIHILFDLMAWSHKQIFSFSFTEHHQDCLLECLGLSLLNYYFFPPSSSY